MRRGDGDKRKRLYFLVPLTALFSLLSDWGELHFHFAMGPADHAAGSAEDFSVEIVGLVFTKYDWEA